MPPALLSVLLVITFASFTWCLAPTAPLTAPFFRQMSIANTSEEKLALYQPAGNLDRQTLMPTLSYVALPCKLPQGIFYSESDIHLDT